ASLNATTTHPFSLFTPPPTHQIYTLSLHDALPIFAVMPSTTPVAFLPTFTLAMMAFQSSFFACFACSFGMYPMVRPSTSIRTALDRKSTRLNSSHLVISYAVFCLKNKTDMFLVTCP